MPAIGRLTTGVVYIRSIGGTLTFSSGGVLSLASGTAAAPGQTWDSDAGLDTGQFLIGANNVGFTAGGVLRWDYNTTRIDTTLPIQLSDGTVTAPGLSFTNQIGLGWYRPAAGNMTLADSGYSTVPPVTFNPQGVILANQYLLRWTSSSSALLGTIEVSLLNEGPGIFSQRDGTVAQTQRWYATFTDVTNYERFAVSTTAGGANITLAAQTAGTGVDNIGLTLTPAGTGTVNTAASIVSSGATAGIGYTTGAGGAVTQLTDKATGVTLNTVTGEITMTAAALAGDTTVTFTLTNSAIAATDLVLITHDSAGTAGSYTVTAQGAAGTAAISVRNITTASLSEAIVLKFVVFKAVNA